MQYQVDTDVQAVVVGIDFSFNYRKLAIASLYIQSGAEFIASNKDRNTGTGDRFIPGCGAIVKAIEVASGVEAKVMGKPSTYGFELIKRQIGRAHV